MDTTGAGDAVLMLHGVTGSAATYRWLELEGRALDFRGHGASERAPGAYLLEHYVEDVLSVLDQLTVLVGHSLGGVVAWTVAQRRPDLVRAAFLEDPPLYVGEPEAHAAHGAVDVFRQLRTSIERWQAEGAGEETVRAQLGAQPAASDPARTVADVAAPDALAARAEAVLRLDPEVLDPVLDGSLLAGADTTSPVAVPVFVLAADPALSALPPAHEARLARTHPQVEVVRVPGAGHSIHDERAHRATYAQRLSAFLSEHAG